LPKEIPDYLNKMGARIPNIKPGKATIDYLTKIQASTRFWGIYFSESCKICNITFF
jgi:preprotein translocase subunit SecY